MPVRSLNSSVLKWPTYEEVIYKLKEWIKEVIEKRNDVLKIGFFGSYARGDFGIGSDLDLIIIVESSKLPFER
ncbi:MAG: nucleotidyltransferase domain-containing protein, partial [bacterium]